MILALSYKLMSRDFIADNVSHVIRSIHVGEFQDTNETQHQILACLVQKNNAINVAFVGETRVKLFLNYVC